MPGHITFQCNAVFKMFMILITEVIHLAHTQLNDYLLYPVYGTLCHTYRAA